MVIGKRVWPVETKLCALRLLRAFFDGDQGRSFRAPKLLVTSIRWEASMTSAVPEMAADGLPCYKNVAQHNSWVVS